MKLVVSPQSTIFTQISRKTSKYFWLSSFFIEERKKAGSIIYHHLKERAKETLQI